MPNSARKASDSFLYALLVILLLRAVAYSQVDTGALVGTVKDESGGVVPNAKVTLTNNGTGFRLATTTGSDGTYVFTPIKIGVYTVEAEATGFETVKRTNITVQVQQQVVVDFVLRPGQVTQTVEVTAAAPLLQTEGGSVGQVVGSRTINDLPLNGRNYTFLAQLSAGVTKGQPEGRGMNAHGTYVANGVIEAQNNYLLDGMDNNSDVVDFLNGAQYIVQPPVDAIQEFKLETSDYSAQFGRAAGAVLNATTKSGTNKFHGDTWEFVRNDAFDAADFFENTASRPKSEYRQNQFGFSLGGPVYLPRIYDGHDKTFFFADYEGTRIRQGQLFSGLTVPTLLERNSGYTDFQDLITGQKGTLTDALGRSFPLGTIFNPATTRPVSAGQIDPVTGLIAQQTGYVRDPFPGNIIPASLLDSNAIRLLNQYPLPTNSSLFGNFSTSPVQQNNTNTFDIRVDQNFSDRDTMFVRVSYLDSPVSTPPPLGPIADQRGYNPGFGINTARNVVWSETHSFSPTTINELRVGFSGIHITRVQSNYNVMGIPQQFGIQGVPQYSSNGGLPDFNIGGLSGLGAGVFIPAIEYNTTVQLTENLTKVYKSHTFKGGFEFQHLKVATEEPLSPRGEFYYGGVYTSIPTVGDSSTGRAQFVIKPMPTIVPNGIDNVGAANGVQISNSALVDDGANYEGAYFQDNWKMSPKLTWNLGVRWEYFSPMWENFNAQANFVPGTPFAGAEFMIPNNRRDIPLSPSFLSLLKQDGIALDYTTNEGMALAQKFNFGPRVGFAYQISPKLVIRGGYGMFYNGFESLGFLPNLGQNYPFNFGLSQFAPDNAHPVTPDLSIGPFETSLLHMPLNPANVNAEGLLLRASQYNTQTPYTQSANFTIQYQLTPNQYFQIGYVGTFARHLQIFSGADLPSQILPPNANVQEFVPFPDFAVGSSYVTDQGNSHYNSLQATFERRFSTGLSFLANYTYAKAMDDAHDLLNPGGDVFIYRAPLVPGFGIQGDYSLANFDIRNSVHLSGIYELPFGRGRHFLRNASGLLNQLAGGWQTNWILTLQDGFPFSIPCSVQTVNEGTTQNILGWIGCYALLVPGQNPIAGKHDVNQWMNPLAFTNPPAATTISQGNFAPLGGMGDQVAGPGFHRLDFSLFKEFQTTESTHLEFRAEFFNITNTPQLGLPSFRNFTNIANFGQILSTSDAPNDPRQIQFALKFYW